MTDREKLIALIKESWCWTDEEIADHLLANGVVVQTEDEKRNTYTVQEIEEIQNEAYDLGVDSVLHNHFGLSWKDAAELREAIAELKVDNERLREMWAKTTAELSKAKAERGRGVWEGVDSSYWRWFPTGVKAVERVTYRCTKCGRGTAVKTNFCPNCGADMRKGENE